MGDKRNFMGRLIAGYYVVQTEVSFVSNRRDSDKPEKITEYLDSFWQLPMNIVLL